MSNVTIAVDAMSGDYGPSVAVPAALNILKKMPDLHLILVGDQDVLNDHIQKHRFKNDNRLTVIHSTEIVDMDELPSKALRYKKDSSMRVAINLVKQGKAEACVSSGNTGALMATAHFVLKMLPGIERPAILGLMPAENKYERVRMLDLGANVDSSSKNLFQFAVMGAVLTRAIDNIEKPTVALLNIGVEEMKGNEQVKETSRLLSEFKGINYIGYIEGNDIFKGHADVIVCDGFVGNVTLKTIEGLAKFITRIIKKAFQKNFLTRIAGGCAYFVLNALKKQLNPARYDGASFVGLKGIVVKCHGATTIKGFEKAIELAVQEVQQNVPQLIEDQIATLLKQNSSK